MSRKIRRRITENRIILLSMIRNPYTEGEDQAKLSETLNAEMRELSDDEEIQNEELDREGMAALKARLASESRFIKVK